MTAAAGDRCKRDRDKRRRGDRPTRARAPSWPPRRPRRLPHTTAAKTEPASAGAEDDADEPSSADDKSDDDDDDKETRDATEKAAVKKPHISVAIKSDPDGTQVSTRRRTYGVTPISLKLRPGSYELTFTKAGYLPTTKTVQVASSTHSIHVSLKRAPPPPKPAPAAAAPPPESKKNWWQRHFSR